MKELILDRKEIEEIAERIALQLKEKFKDSPLPPVFIGVLKGAMPFMMELMKHIDFDCEEDFVQYSSYIRTESSGMVVLKKDIETNIENRDVVVIEDIVDTGRTLQKFTDYLSSKNPRSITTVTMLDKPSRRVVNFNPTFTGKTIDDKFVVGFGLDYQEYLRNVNYVYVIDKEELKHVDELAAKKK